jgi:hypothetical protein
VKKKRDDAEQTAYEARIEEHRRRFHEIAQRAVDDLNARRPPGTPPWPDRVPVPGRNGTKAEWAAWRAQAADNSRRLSDLAEKAQAELDRKKPETGAA